MTYFIQMLYRVGYRTRNGNFHSSIKVSSIREFPRAVRTFRHFRKKKKKKKKKKIPSLQRLAREAGRETPFPPPPKRTV
ncbi:hypothetical protein PUN28_014666 [Cardiocondyla obscurior]|uniref:Uncharacterized protein n=1 Tax=Cardiocondyla obscurior TaxID=286306 RepID=A0AAW2EYL4_9HYME